MDCMKLKVANENLKVHQALCPQQRCPNKTQLCPPENKMRSSLYHPDFRTENEYCCTKSCCYVPTETAMKVIKYKPPNQNLYNQPKLEGGRIKILMDRSCPSPRDINKLYCNLQGPTSCAGQNTRQLYICNDCGCGYQDTRDDDPCGPKAKSSPSNPVYFEVDSCGMVNQDQDCGQDQCESGAECADDFSVPPGAPSRNHFQDCQCGLCKRRRSGDRCCSGTQDPMKSKSSLRNAIKCENPECGSCHSQMQNKEDVNCNRTTGCDTGQSCCTQPNMIASLPDPNCPERSNQVPCHHVFKLGNEVKQQPTAHCVIDMSSRIIQNGDCAGAGAGTVPCVQSSPPPCVSACWPNAFGNGIPVNQCAPKQRKKVCNCFYCDVVQNGKEAIHGPHCPCNLCQRMRCQSSKRPYYYSHLKSKSQCKDKKTTTTCSVSSIPVCYPIKSIKCEVKRRECGTSRRTCAVLQKSQCESNLANTDPAQSQYSCKSNCLCHVMIPKEWEPHDYGNQNGNSCGAKPVKCNIKLPSCKSQRRNGNGCDKPPYLVRSLDKVKRNKNGCVGEGSSSKGSKCRASSSPKCSNFKS